jgi:hypothetical protein
MVLMLVRLAAKNSESEARSSDWFLGTALLGRAFSLLEYLRKADLGPSQNIIAIEIIPNQTQPHSSTRTTQVKSHTTLPTPWTPQT